MIKYFYKIFLFSVSRFLILIDLIFRKIFNRYLFLPSIHDYIESRQYYEKIIHDLNEQKDNKYIIYYDILELVKSNNKKIRAEEENKLNWEIYDCDKIICNIKSNKRKVEILYEDNIITINNDKWIQYSYFLPKQYKCTCKTELRGLHYIYTYI